MADKQSSCRLGTIGGQAVIEGVMMKNKTRCATALRMPDGNIQVHTTEFVSVRTRHKWLGFPVLRGVVNFIEMLILSFKTLSLSADAFVTEEDEEPVSDKAMALLMAVSGVLGVLLAVGLFFLLPTYVTKGIDYLVGGTLGIWGNIVEGLVKIVIFVCYLLAVSLMKDIRRTFEYHGAEHKSIFCYEAGEELTVENVKKHRRFHPRCGTSFLFVMVILSIFVSALPFMPTWENSLLRVLLKLCMFPLIVGIGYEFIFYAGKHDNLVTRILSAPGLWMQRITTREPDGEQIEIAICALKMALPDVFGELPPELSHITVFADKVQIYPPLAAEAPAEENTPAEAEDAPLPETPEDDA